MRKYKRGRRYTTETRKNEKTLRKVKTSGEGGIKNMEEWEESRLCSWREVKRGYKSRPGTEGSGANAWRWHLDAGKKNKDAGRDGKVTSEQWIEKRRGKKGHQREKKHRIEEEGQPSGQWVKEERRGRLGTKKVRGGDQSGRAAKAKAKMSKCRNGGVVEGEKDHNS